MNLPAIIKDEICLEGLEGITLEGLWQRIKNRPSSNENFCESSKVFNLCWDHIKSQPYYEFYQLPEPRNRVQLDKNSLDGADEDDEPKFKINIIEGEVLMGSCEAYSTRKAIALAKLKPLDYEAVMAQFGNKLVIVADQKSRYKAIIPDQLYLPPGLMSHQEFAILERVARSRGSGVPCAGKNSLLDIVPDHRSVYHRRENLCKMGLVLTRKKMVKGNTNTFLYLPRFADKVKDSNRHKMSLLKQMVDEAKEDPDNLITTWRVNEILKESANEETPINLKLFRKTSMFVKTFKVVRVPKPAPGTKKIIHTNCLQLTALKVGTSDDDEETDEAESSQKQQESFLNTDGQYYGVPPEKQVLITVETMGAVGSTMQEVSQILGMPLISIRNSFKALLRTKSVFEEKRQLKSVSSTFYISTRFKDAEKEKTEKKLLTAARVPKVKQVAEEPMNLTLVDVYGVPTTINVVRLTKLTKSMKMDTESHAKRVQVVLDVILSFGITSNLNSITRRLSITMGAVICRKTVTRIVQSLMEQGSVATYKATFVREKDTRVTNIFCDTSAYNMRHGQFVDMLNVLHKKMVPIVNANMQRMPVRKQMKYLIASESRFMHFEVLRPIHELLVYLAWLNIEVKEDDRDTIDNPLEPPEEWLEEMDNDETLPSIYHRELGYKTFVPKRRVEKDGVGWITIRELSQCLPLQLVYDMYNPIDNAPNVPQSLQHPIKKFFMMSQLRLVPIALHKFCLDALVKSLKKLCFLGLLRFGSSVTEGGSSLIDTPIYVNRKTMLTDTTTSDQVRTLTEGKHPQFSYEFTSAQVVDRYWENFHSIAANTLLPRRKLIGSIRIYQDLAAILEPIAKEDAERLDDGSRPGDGRGAAGMFSGLCVHMLLYWDPKYKPTEARPKIARLVAKGFTRPTKPKRPPKKRRQDKKWYDEVDKYARGMSGLRSKWSPAEDTALLLARLANLHLAANRSHMQLISCIAYRDVLHWICQSLDKSAKMCSRRVLFLCKNEVTKTTMEMCLKEMSCTPAVMKRFGPEYLQELKRRYGDEEEEYVSAVKISFVQLVRILSEIYSKFTSNAFQKRAGAVLPDTAEQFLERFEVQEEDETADWEKLEGEERRMMNVVYNVIHSSMCCAEDNVPYNMFLLEVYKNYPENILSLAMDKAIVGGMITKHKINTIGARRTIPLNTQPFHLSMYYMRRFLINFNYDTLEQVVNWIEEARRGKEEFGGITRTFAFFFLGLNSRNAIDVKLTVPKTIRKVPLGAQHMDDQLAVVAKKDVIAAAAKKKKTVSFKNEVVICDFDYEPSEIMLKLNPLNWHILCYMKECVGLKVFSLDNKKSMEVKDGRCNFACSIEKFHDVDEMDDLLSKTNVRDYKEEIKRMLKDLRAEKEKLVEVNKKDLGKIASLKRTNHKFISLLDDLARDTFDPLVQRIFEIRLKDGVEFPRKANKDLFNERLLNWAVIEEEPKKSLMELFGANQKKVNSLVEFVKQAGVEGVSGVEIWNRFSNNPIDDLEDKLKTLLDNHWILFCGEQEVKFVHKEFKDQWITKSHTMSEAPSPEKNEEVGRSIYLRKRGAPSTPDQLHPKQAKIRYYDKPIPEEWKSKDAQNISLRMFPWIRIIGTINQRVVDRIIGTIILFMQGESGLPVQRLFQKFKYFHESHLVLILWLMKDIGLIRVYKCAPKKATLLSTFESPEIESTSLLFTDPEELFLESTEDSVLSYCEIRGERNYKNNYF